MLRLIILGLIVLSLLTGCSCGCNKAGPTIEKNPQPVQSETLPTTHTTSNNPNLNPSTDCGCGGTK